MSAVLPTCPTSAELTGIALAGALLVASVTGFVVHGILRPLLEARGVAPWTQRDSLGSTPLILLGAALIGGALASGAAMAAAPCLRSAVLVAVVAFAIAAGLAMMKLGLVAIRKVV